MPGSSEVDKHPGFLCLQGLQSSHPGVACFCTSAMLHCEAFLHPRTSAQFLEAIPESRLPATGERGSCSQTQEI